MRILALKCALTPICGPALSAVSGWGMVPRILVVDDEPINRLVMEQFLQMLECDVHEARNGHEALARLGEDEFDLIFLDIHMPELSGFHVVEQLRAGASPNNGIPVMAVTADTSKPRSQYLAAGFTGYVNKPVEFEVIADLVASLAPPPRQTAA